MKLTYSQPVGTKKCKSVLMSKLRTLGMMYFHFHFMGVLLRPTNLGHNLIKSTLEPRGAQHVQQTIFWGGLTQLK